MMRILIILLKTLGMLFMSSFRQLRKILVVVYIAVILWITIFSRDIGTERILRGLFWEIKQGYWKDIILNILLFVPVGCLVGGRKAIVFGIVLSLGIEIIQYVFRLGYCEVDDVINNTLGVLAGTLIYFFMGKKR